MFRHHVSLHFQKWDTVECVFSWKRGFWRWKVLESPVCTVNLCTKQNLFRTPKCSFFWGFLARTACVSVSVCAWTSWRAWRPYAVKLLGASSQWPLIYESYQYIRQVSQLSCWQSMFPCDLSDRTLVKSGSSGGMRGVLGRRSRGGRVEKRL